MAAMDKASKSANAARPSPIAIQMVPVARAVRSGEPIRVRVTVKNLSKEPVLISRSMTLNLSPALPAL